MSLRVENRARLAIILIILALLFAFCLSLILYAQAQRENDAHRLARFKLEAQLLTSLLWQHQNNLSNEELKELLINNGISANASIYSADGTLLYRATTIDLSTTLQTDILQDAGRLTPSSHSEILVRNQNGSYLSLSKISGAKLLVLTRPVDNTSSRYPYYILSYQIIALTGGIFLIYALARWLLRPYRRLVKAAQGSPVRASAAKSESEFVVETFQALIEQLQMKEAELARLHALEKSRAEKSERFSERLIANIPSGLVAIDSRGFITSLNAYGRNLLTPGEEKTVKGRTGALESPHWLNYEAFFQPAPKIISMIRECLTSGRAFKREEVDILQDNSRPRKLGMSVSPIVDAQQKIEGALCMMTDITEVTELRERLKLQETLANLGEMAAGLAHEFKNSLATIQGYAQLLDNQNQAPPPVASEQTRETLPQTKLALNGMLKEVELLSRLVTDFLNFARPQQLYLCEVNLESMIFDCMEEARTQPGSEEIDISASGTFPIIAADDSLLRRVFINLIRNAVESIDSESKRKQIEIHGSVDSGTGRRYAHIRFSDTGSGIPPSYLPNLFIPFFTTKSRGYGIGLAIVQKIMVAHGGDVTVERSDSTGTVFHCRLPLVSAKTPVETM